MAWWQRLPSAASHPKLFSTCLSSLGAACVDRNAGRVGLHHCCSSHAKIPACGAMPGSDPPDAGCLAVKSYSFAATSPMRAAALNMAAYLARAGCVTGLSLRKQVLETWCKTRRGKSVSLFMHTDIGWQRQKGLWYSRWLRLWLDDYKQHHRTLSLRIYIYIYLTKRVFKYSIQSGIHSYCVKCYYFGNMQAQCYPSIHTVLPTKSVVRLQLPLVVLGDGLSAGHIHFGADLPGSPQRTWWSTP